MLDAAGSVAWSYDARGRTVTEARSFAGPYTILGTYSLTYTYDAADRVKTVQYPDGEVITTNYTPRGLPNQLTSSLGPQYVQSASYDEQARLKSLTSGNGLPTVYTYNTFNPTTQQGDRLQSLTVGNTLLNLSYGYDKVGNITSMSDATLGQSLTFTYDPLDRLTSAAASGGSGAYSETYQYNAIGNLTQRQTATQTLAYSYPSPGSARPHAATQAGSNTYQYDANGNMGQRTEGGITYSQSWNAENKLKQVTWTQGGQTYTTTFMYDGDNNRLLKIEDTSLGQETTTLYIGQIYEEQRNTTANNLQTAVQGDWRLEIGDWAQMGERMTDEQMADESGQVVWIAPSVGEVEERQGGGSEAMRLPTREGLGEGPALAQSANPSTLQLSTFQLSTLPPFHPSKKSAGLAAPLWQAPIVTTTVASSTVGDMQRSHVVSPMSNFSQLVAALYYLSYIRTDPDDSWQAAVCSNELTFVKRDDLAGGSSWKSDPNFTSPFWAPNSAPSCGTWSGGAQLGPCTTAQNGYVATNFFRELFELQPPQPGYVLDKVFLDRAGDNDSVWYINGFQEGGTPAGTAIGRDITGLVHQDTQVNLLAVQTGNKPICLNASQHDNVTWTAWRIQARWHYEGNPTPVMVPEPAYTPGATNVVYWSIAENLEPLVSSYEVQRATNSSFSGAITATTTEAQYAFSGLANGQIYYYRVRSFNSWNQPSGWSTVTSSTQDAAPPAVTVGISPNTPYLTSPTFTVSWSASDSGSGLAATNGYTYTVERSLNGGAFLTWLTTNALSTTVVGQDLTTYAFRVRVKDQVGNEAVSTSVATIVNLFPPQAGPLSANPRFISPNGDNRNDSTVITATVSNTITNWTLAILSGTTTISSGIGTTTPISWTWAGRKSNGTLTTDGAYTVTFTATNTLGNVTTSTAPSLVFVDTVSPTVSLTVSPTTTSGFVVSWSGSDSGLGSVLNYNLRSGETASGPWTDILTNTQSLSTTVSGKVGRSYYFQVQAQDYAGNLSAWVQAGPYTIDRLVTKYYVFGGSRVAMRQGGVVYYLHGDHLGSVSLTTDSSGNRVSEARYLPYGQTRFGSTGPTDFGFTAQRNDSFGLMDYNARFYDPYLNRFISADTVVPEPGNPQHWSRYSYGYNNPIRYTDPSGHQGEPWWQTIINSIREWWIMHNPCSGMLGGCYIPTPPPSTVDVAEEVLKTAQSAAGFDNSSLPNEPLIAPADLQNVQQFVNAFQAVEEGVSSWNEFQHTSKGTFTGEYKGSANVGWKAYKQSNQSDSTLVIGRRDDVRPYDNQEDYGTLRIQGWNLRVNDSWMQGGIDRDATFKLASPMTDETLWDEGYDPQNLYLTEM